MTQTVKALDESCLRYVGELLLFNVYYGYGWQGTTHGPSPENWQSMDTPPNFHLRIHSFFDWYGVLGGGVAVVEETGHALDGQWALFIPRYFGTHDFTDHLTNYTISTGPAEPMIFDPRIDPEYAKIEPDCRAFTPVWRFLSGPEAVGFGMIAENSEYIKTWEEESARQAAQEPSAHWLRQKDYKPVLR